MAPSVRLQKLLAGWGLASRRTIEEWMLAGRITVNDVVADQPGLTVDPETVRITVDGKRISPPSQARAVGLVVMLHKPAGVLTTMEDPHGRPTVAELISYQQRLYPIGRLDLDSTGLLLLTNDGELTNRLLHPRYKVEKEYRVRIAESPLTPVERQRFAGGLMLEDGMTAPCHIRCVDAGVYLVRLREGRKRQIKRMFGALGRTVVALHRERFGPIALGNLPEGSSRVLYDQELEQLYRAVTLESRP